MNTDRDINLLRFLTSGGRTGVLSVEYESQSLMCTFEMKQATSKDVKLNKSRFGISVASGYTASATQKKTVQSGVGSMGASAEEEMQTRRTSAVPHSSPLVISACDAELASQPNAVDSEQLANLDPEEPVGATEISLVGEMALMAVNRLHVRSGQCTVVTEYSVLCSCESGT